ncbi:GyrB-like ATPase domain protein [Nile crocodilepox virus]|uniref:GyrB-like ATPase domain protein n=1 Tax=Nile crocodilepox virus (isolate Crocodylus niloticus/Zimbabwe/Ume/2001) TaxID=1289473 RepID=Q070G7_CPRVZ|nr:GyrB-like ATPase domain protein [Nile crocodilepox virus]ABJ08975.1 GyrB-like ATPase domain protein [Nile crocodilepox virus]
MTSEYCHVRPHVARSVFEIVGPTDVERHPTLFRGSVRCHTGACRMVREVVENAIDHCACVRAASVYVEVRRHEVTVINTSSMTIKGTVDGVRCIVPQTMITEMFTLGRSEGRAVSGGHGVGLKIVNALAKRIRIEVSDETCSFIYSSRNGALGIGTVNSAPIRDARLGSNFFKVSFSIAGEAFNTTQAQACLNLEDYVAALLEECVFYLVEMQKDVRVYLNGQQVPYRGDMLMERYCLSKELLVTYPGVTGKRVVGSARAYFCRRDMDTLCLPNDRYALVNAHSVRHISIFRSLLNRIADVRPELTDVELSVVLLVDCGGVVFSAYDKLSVTGTFEMRSTLFHARELDPLCVINGPAILAAAQPPPLPAATPALPVPLFAPAPSTTTRNGRRQTSVSAPATPQPATRPSSLPSFPAPHRSLSLPAPAAVPASQVQPPVPIEHKPLWKRLNKNYTLFAVDAAILAYASISIPSLWGCGKVLTALTVRYLITRYMP